MYAVCNHQALRVAFKYLTTFRLIIRFLIRPNLPTMRTANRGRAASATNWSSPPTTSCGRSCSLSLTRNCYFTPYRHKCSPVPLNNKIIVILLRSFVLCLSPWTPILREPKTLWKCSRNLANIFYGPSSRILAFLDCKLKVILLCSVQCNHYKN